MGRRQNQDGGEGTEVLTAAKPAILRRLLGEEGWLLSDFSENRENSETQFWRRSRGSPRKTGQTETSARLERDLCRRQANDIIWCRSTLFGIS